MKNEIAYNSILNKFKGYSNKFPRQEYLLLRILKDSEWNLYTLIKYVITDWDSRHQMYGLFNYQPDTIAQAINWSESKVRRNFNNLQKYKLIKIVDKRHGIYSLEGYELTDRAFIKHEPPLQPFEYLRILLCATLKKSTSFLKHNKASLNKTFADLEISTDTRLDLPTNNKSKSRFNIVSFKGNLVYRDREQDKESETIDIEELLEIID